MLDQQVYFVSADDGQIWEASAGRQVTSSSQPYAGISPFEGGLIAVRGSKDGDELTWIDVESGAATVLHRYDFISSPVATGSMIAWTQWPENTMPWNHCEVWVSVVNPDMSLGTPHRVAGGPGESAIQPQWSPDGDLYLMSDRSDRWNLYRQGESEAVAALDLDCSPAPWEMNYSSYTFLNNNRIALIGRHGPRVHLLVVDETGSVREIDTAYTSIKPYLTTLGDRIALIGSSATVAQEMALVNPDEPSEAQVVHRPGTFNDPAGTRSHPQLIEIESDGQPITTIVHPASSSEHGSPAPMIIRAHPGPTHGSELRIDAEVMFFTAQGFTVVDVDYRGSTGYGRQFRLSLNGAWGIKDVTDCENAARHFIDVGQSCEGAVFISGASAGGFTALKAATKGGSPFAGAVAKSAIVNPDAWAAVTPRFHRPNALALTHEGAAVDPSQIGIPVALIHAQDDYVVPINDIEKLAATLTAKNRRHTFAPLDSGGHYLSDPLIRAKALRTELEFYKQILTEPTP
ncbi:alpha/beta hydrolase family protein [Natronoglycomyces albus]|uniref:S9 family peptidase n=1 Tax=Natronoglycomyces albus TaxID=2811108 RepID=A0A895XWB7_9ACTN|nr:prolyl oligopeptidase family serine peptidase [Natronoglycomyces albus]QSB06520.1 S9 family peptidase [Natronoglycomyces albus]